MEPSTENATICSSHGDYQILKPSVNSLCALEDWLSPWFFILDIFHELGKIYIFGDLADSHLHMEGSVSFLCCWASSCSSPRVEPPPLEQGGPGSLPGPGQQVQRTDQAKSPACHHCPEEHNVLVLQKKRGVSVSQAWHHIKHSSYTYSCWQLLKPGR